MKCPACGHADSRVIDSRPTEEGAALRRRRQCDDCGYRFTTHERVQTVPLMVVKKDGRREEFDADKLLGGVAKACNKRPVSMDSLNKLVQDVESTLRLENANEVPAERIGEVVMEYLIHLDQVAYVRFASVYQRFDDVKRFAQILERIGRRARRLERAQPDGKAEGKAEGKADGKAEAKADGKAEGKADGKADGKA